MINRFLGSDECRTMNRLMARLITTTFINWVFDSTGETRLSTWIP